MEIALSRAARGGYKPAHLAGAAAPAETPVATTHTPDWPKALDAIDAAVSAALEELERYEARWREAAVLAGGGRRPPDVNARPGADAARPSETAAGWDDRLAAVAELAGAADRDLAGGLGAVDLWRESLQRALPLVGGGPCHESR